MPEETKNIAWYKRKEVWGGVLSSASGILMLFSPNTAAYKIGVGLGIVISCAGLRTGYQADNLPSGITKAMDKIPDSITGTKGELIKR